MKSFIINYSTYVRTYLILFILLQLVNVIFSQPAKKSLLTFNSTLGHGNSEDWPTYIFPSSDCIHIYFAGWSQYTNPDPCGNDDEKQIPILGKFNSITNKLVWEREYNIGTGNKGAFVTVIEMGGSLWATGVQNETNCGEGKKIILQANPMNGDPIDGPKEVSFPTIPQGFTGFGANFFPIIEEDGTVSGMIGCGAMNKNNDPYNETSHIFITDNQGNIDTDFGDNGYYIGPPNSRSYQAIKVHNHPTIKYAYIGYIINSSGNYDVLIEALDVEGKVVKNWDKFQISELSLGNSYTDLADPGTVCQQTGFETENEYGWDIEQEGDALFLSCKFDGLEYNREDLKNPGLNKCPGFANKAQYIYYDVALVKVDLNFLDPNKNNENAPKVNSTINVGPSDAQDHQPDLEIQDGVIYVLGANTYSEDGKPHTDGKLTSYNSDLTPASKKERIFKDDGWEIICPFDMAFNCDGELIITNNNEFEITIGEQEEESEDYLFYKFSNGCQSSIIKDPSSDIVSNLIINSGNSPFTINELKKVFATIIVEPNGVLNINSNATLEFASSGDLIDVDILTKNLSTEVVPRIIVKNGGILNLNECTLKGLSECPNNAMWDGIHLLNGGLINLNGATIQDAKYGILSSNARYTQSGLNHEFSGGGGKVISSGGLIHNCQIGMFFGQTASTINTITGTIFSCDAYLKDPIYKVYVPNNIHPFSKTQRLGTSHFIYAHNVFSNIVVNSASFSNIAYIPISLRGIGIYSYSSKMNILGSDFSSLYQGIYSINAFGSRFLNIQNGNTFSLNYTGILFKGGNLHVVLDNTFNCSYKNVPLINASWNSPRPGLGIYNAATTKTLFEENKLSSGLNSALNGSFGIISENTGSAARLHRKNIFTNIDRGDQTQEKNAGLNLWCNKYTSTTKAWSINILGSGVFKHQGECNDRQKLYPDNKFYDNCDPSNPELKHAHSEITPLFDYWRNTEAEFPKLECSKNMTLKSIQNQCNSIGSLLSGCSASAPITSGNADQYFSVVPTLPEGTERQLLVNDLLRYYLGEGDMTKVKSLLNNESDINYKMLYAEVLLEEGQITAAQTIVNNMPSSSPEKADYASFFTVLVYAQQNNISLSELPEDKLNILQDLAEGRSIGAYRSQSILIEYYNQSYTLIVETESGIEFRSRKQSELISNSKSILLSPIPTNENLEIKLLDIDNSIEGLSICNIDGKLAYTSTFNKPVKLVVQDVSFLKDGIYFLQIIDSKNRTLTKKFIKN